MPDASASPPVLAVTAEAFGADRAGVARAAVLGEMATGFPLSPLTEAPFVLVGMTACNSANISASSSAGRSARRS